MATKKDNMENYKVALEHLEKEIDREDCRDRNFEIKSNYILVAATALMLIVATIIDKLANEYILVKTLLILAILIICVSIYFGLKVLATADYHKVDENFNNEDLMGDSVEFYRKLTSTISDNLYKNRKVTERKAKYYSISLLKLKLSFLVVVVAVLLNTGMGVN